MTPPTRCWISAILPAQISLAFVVAGMIASVRYDEQMKSLGKVCSLAAGFMLGFAVVNTILSKSVGPLELGLATAGIVLLSVSLVLNRPVR
jgi:hypothetical protein